MGRVMYAIFNSIEDFNSWHENIKLELGIPDEYTIAYTQPYESAVLGSSEIYCFIDEQVDSTNLNMKTREELIQDGIMKLFVAQDLEG